MHNVLVEISLLKSLKEYTGLAEIPSDGPLSYKRIRLGRF